jgi:hypothetical protein
MAASFPSSKKSYSSKTDNVDDVDAEDINELQEESAAIQNLFWRNSIAYETNARNTIGTGSWTVVDYEDEIYDEQDAVTTGSSWKFEPPVDGLYSVDACIHFESATMAGNEIFALRVSINGSSYRVIDETYIQSGGQSRAVFLGGSTKIDVNTDDDVNIEVYQSTGAAKTISSSADYNHVEIALIGTPAA